MPTVTRILYDPIHVWQFHPPTHNRTQESHATRRPPAGRWFESGRGRRIGQAASEPTACPILLPLLDELRTYCYENKIEEIPALLAV